MPIMARPVSPADYNDVQRLVEHLGSRHPLDTPGLAITYRELLGDPDWEAYVAVEGTSEGPGEGPAVGLVTIRFGNALHACGMLAEIQELVVDPGQQGKGVGRALCEKAVERARDRFCRKIVVTSNRAEKDPAGFYESVGFHEVAGSYAIFLGKM
ncbi:MAG: GNAT family N-acetyltransferase [bacterium]